MSRSQLKLSLIYGGLASLSILTACGGGGGSSSSTNSTPAPVPDTRAPVVTFSPAAITTESELSVDVVLTATDNVGITSGPTVVCVNNEVGGVGTFSDNVFTAPYVISIVTNICTATASDAAGNTGEATLTVTINPAPDFGRTSDIITTDPVLGMVNIPTEPGTLVGLMKDASTGSVSSFAASVDASVDENGAFEEAVVTTQSSLGNVGTAPLDTFFANTSGVVGGLSDLVFLDDVNDELVAIPLNTDNTFGLPMTQSVPNACTAGRGAENIASAPGTGRDDTVVTDILVGTPNGLFYIEAGDANEGGPSGLSAPRSLISDGNFCNLYVDKFVRRTIYVVFNSESRIISAYQGSSDNAESYELEFEADISERVPADAVHLLTSGFQDGFGLDTVYNVFTNPAGGTILVQNSTGGRQPITNYDLDIETPTEIHVFESSGRERVVLVSPTSEVAAYIPNADSIGDEIEYIEIGLGFDQVDFSEDSFSLTFSSSTQSDIVVRKFL